MFRNNKSFASSKIRKTFSTISCQLELINKFQIIRELKEDQNEKTFRSRSDRGEIFVLSVTKQFVRGR